MTREEIAEIIGPTLCRGHGYGPCQERHELVLADALRADLEREKETHRLDIALVLKLERQVNASVPKEVYAAQAETVTQLRGELIAAQGSINEKLQIIGLQRAALAVWKEAYPGDANPGMTATALRADLRVCAEALRNLVAVCDKHGMSFDPETVQADKALARPGVKEAKK